MFTKESFWAVFAFLVVAIEALTRFRDAIVKQFGITSENRWLGWAARMALRKQQSEVISVLTNIGFTGDHLRAIRHLDVRLKRQPKTPVEFQLFEAIRLGIQDAPGGYHRDDVNNSLYIDTADGTYYPRPSEPLLKDILYNWLYLLQRNQRIPQFDCIIANKIGNPTLVVDLWRTYFPDLSVGCIVCKGDRDPSRTGVPNRSTVDFEGLAPFIEANKARVGLARSDASYKFSAVIADDNCTTAASVCSMAQRFNELIRTQNLPFALVEHAVVLFNVRSDLTEAKCRAVGLNLHSLMSFGDTEFERIRSTSSEELMKSIGDFKTGFGCDSSRAFNPTLFSG
jgi:hypothetical protein